MEQMGGACHRTRHRSHLWPIVLVDMVPAGGLAGQQPVNRSEAQGSGRRTVHGICLWQVLCPVHRSPGAVFGMGGVTGDETGRGRISKEECVLPAGMLLGRVMYASSQMKVCADLKMVQRARHCCE